jgi:hypothetical protein
LLSSSSVFQLAAVPGGRNSISQPAQCPQRYAQSKIFTMTKSKTNLPHESADLFFADGGLETTRLRLRAESFPNTPPNAKP